MIFVAPHRGNAPPVMVFARARALRGRTKIVIAAVNCHDECAESNDRWTGIAITWLRGISLFFLPPLSLFPDAYKVRSASELRRYSYSHVQDLRV